MNARRIGWLVGLVGMFAVAGPRPVAAQPIVMKRGVENLSMAPLDFWVAPYTAWVTLDQHLENVESTGGKVATSIIGWPYYWGLYVVLAGFREAAGIVELPIGLFAWPVTAMTDVEISPFFDTAEAAALVDVHASPFEFKGGGRWLGTR